MQYSGEPQHPQVWPQRGEGQSLDDKEDSYTIICNNHGKGSCKIDDEFKACECDCWAYLGHLDHIAITRSYGVLRPQTGKVDVYLWGQSVKLITLPKQTTAEEIAAALPFWHFWCQSKHRMSL